MPNKRVTIKDLAASLSLSTATVSLALSGKGDAYRIAPATRKRIEKEAARLGYRPNHLARSMRRGKTDTIGVLFPNVTESYMNHILEGIEETANSRNISMMIATSSFDYRIEARNLNSLLDRRVDGLLLVPYAPFRNEEYDDSAIRRAAASGTPMVALDRFIPGIIDYAVLGGDLDAACRAAELLVSKGCRRPAYVGLDLLIATLEDRRNGFHQIMQASGLEDNTVEFLVSERNPGSSDIRDWLTGLLEAGRLPDAFFIPTNGLALRVRSLLMELTGSGPGEGLYNIVRFGEDSRYFPTGMAAVTQQHRNLGRVAMEKLLALVRGEGIPDDRKIERFDMEIVDATD